MLLQVTLLLDARQHCADVARGSPRPKAKPAELISAARTWAMLIASCHANLRFNFKTGKQIMCLVHEGLE